MILGSMADQWGQDQWKINGSMGSGGSMGGSMGSESFDFQKKGDQWGQSRLIFKKSGSMGSQGINGVRVV